MITVIVGNEDVIKFLHARRVGCRDNAFGIPAVETRPAGINQESWAPRINDQRCLPALHIDEIDFERLERSSAGYGHQR
jgi:hypothetical protein